MGRLILSTAISVNGAFEAPAPDGWFVLDNDSGDDNNRQLVLSDGLLLGRRTYEGLAAVWPALADDPDFGRYATRINAMPKYVASRTLSGPLEWNATLLEGELESAVKKLQEELDGDLYLSGTGEIAHTLTRAGLIDEFWFSVHPSLWADGPRVFEGVGPVRLELIAATPYRSGVVLLRYRSA